MVAPDMRSSNDLARLSQRIDVLTREVRELRSASGTLDSATIYKGSLTVKGGGRVLIEDNGGLYLDGGYLTVANGNIRAVDTDTGAALAYFGELSFSGAPASGLMAETRDDDAYFWVTALDADHEDRQFHFDGKSAYVKADDILLDTAQLKLYSLPTTGSAANLRLETSSGTPLVQWVTSSLRYKDDPADAVIEPREVLNLQGRTWLDKGTVQRVTNAGEDVSTVRRNVGFIAEELDAQPSMRQFVDYDEQGRPDAIQYDRLTVALLELAKAQQAQLDGQADQIAALNTRLEALETA